MIKSSTKTRIKKKSLVPSSLWYRRLQKDIIDLYLLMDRLDPAKRTLCLEKASVMTIKCKLCVNFSSAFRISRVQLSFTKQENFSIQNRFEFV